MDTPETVSTVEDVAASWRPTVLGRDGALADLSAAIADPMCRMVIVRGPAGSGKTALVETALRSIAAAAVLSGEAKFAEGAVQSPYAPILRALSVAVGMALDRLHDPEAVMSGMADALGPGLAVLVGAGFRPEGALAAEPAQGLVGRRQGAVRIVDASLRLLRWLGGFEIPIVLFVDDWRRGGEEARALLEALAAEGDANLTLILAERDDQPPVVPRDGVAARRITVEALAPDDRLALLRAAMGQAGEALFRWFGDACPVLPFDLLAAARALADADAVRLVDGEWRIEAARAAAIGRDDLARTLVNGLATAAPDARTVALATALFGDSARFRDLALALGVSDRRIGVAVAAVASLGILDADGDTIRFRHDRLRGAVQALGREEIHALAAEMADRLAAAADQADFPTWRLALRLRIEAGIGSAPPGPWRDRFAQGARAARSAMDIDAATEFAEAAWRLRTEHPADKTATDRMLVREAILAAADRNDAAAVNERIGALFALPATPAELGDDYELAIAALRLVGERASAWELSRVGLGRLGLKLPANASLVGLLAPLARWKLRLFLSRGHDRALAPDVEVDPFTKVGNAAATLAFERSPLMAALLALRGYERASPEVRRSAFWTANDVFLCAMRGDFETAVRLGEQAFRAVQSPDYSGFARAATLYRALYWGVIWRRPQALLRDHCHEVRDLALAEGDLIQAAVAIRNWVMIGWRTAPSLPAFRVEILQARAELARLGDVDVQTFVAAIAAAVDGLIGEPTPPGASFVGAVPDDAPAWARNMPHDNPLLILELASVHGDWDYIRVTVGRTAEFRRNLDSHPRGADWRFHDGLARLRRGERVPRADTAYLERAARLNPGDNRVKILVLRAEALRARGREAPCLAAFAQAVDAAAAGWSRLEAGIACESAAHAARVFGNAALADHYDHRARETWAAWGASTKAPVSRDPVVERPLDERIAVAEAQTVVAERTARARSRFLADVAHELRTPLQGMQGLLDIAASDPESLDLPAIRDVFASLKTVVDDLTDFGALASGEAPLERRPVSVADLLGSECGVAAPFAREHQASVDLQIAPDVPEWIETDGPRVRQVVRNLLSNAAKYGRGAIIVRARRSSNGSSDGELLVVTVDDHGPGITAGELLHLFEPFERGARTGDGQGLGLGLALARRIALRLGGSLVAENRSVGGARFTFSFPFTVASPPPAESQSRPGRALRILLAEDVPLVRRVLSAILEVQGHEVTEADDGVEAAALLSALDFDLAILDLGMPGLNGLEVMGRIAARPPGQPAAPPVILLTASGEADIAERARRAGAACVLRKPVSAEDLRRAIERCRAAPDGDEAGTPVVDAMASLREEARLDIIARVDALTATGGGAPETNAAEAHRIAGLAAQFGWPEIAAAADAVERAFSENGASPGAAIERLRQTCNGLRGPSQESAGDSVS